MSSWLSNASLIFGISAIGIVVAIKIFDYLRNRNKRDEVLKKYRAIYSGASLKHYSNTFYKIKTPHRIMNVAISRVIDLVEKELEDVPFPEKYPRTIVGLMFRAKLVNAANAQYRFLMLSGVDIALLVNDIQTYGLGCIIGAAGFLLLHLDHKLLEYRVSRGWYGHNEFESREVINFIIAHSNPNDFNDSGGLKKVIPDPRGLLAGEAVRGAGLSQ